MDIEPITDNPQYKKISDTMTRLQTTQVAITERKAAIESILAAPIRENPGSAWQVALNGADDGALVERDRLRQEYEELERKERFNTLAIEEGRQALDGINGRLSMEACHAARPDYLKTVLPKAKAFITAAVVFLDAEEKFVAELSGEDIRIDHLGRVRLPLYLSRESLEAFRKEIEEL
jgi:hypothetical protein